MSDSHRSDGGGPTLSRVPTLAAYAILAIAFGSLLYLDIRSRDAFTWMDPYQYFDFALDWTQGRVHFDEFELPSIFPFFVAPLLVVDPSIPAALSIHFFSMLLLLVAVHLLCGWLRVGLPAPLVALLVLSSPLLTGLSRSLYVEYLLAGLVALGFALWLRLLRAPSRGTLALFVLVFAVGMLTKTTYAVFFVVPIGVAIALRVVSRRDREALRLLASVLAPAVLVLLVQVTVFSRSFAYYLSLGNTVLPIANLVGPSDPLSVASFTYYFRELGRSGLLLLTPFLLPAVWLAVRRPAEGRWTLRWDGDRVQLWLWLVGAPLLLIVPSVKEPRHLAPCVVPAVLLIVLGIEGLSGRRLRNALLALVAIAALVQGASVSLRLIDAPYGLHRALGLAEIEESLREASGRPLPTDAPLDLRLPIWKYGLDIALAGFSGDEALALAWWAFPGVAYDLETLGDPSRYVRDPSNERFQDLYILVGFDTLNRRCGWHGYSETLARDQVLREADFLIVNGAGGPSDPILSTPGYAVVARLPRGVDTIWILRNRRSGRTPFRTLYARQHLARSSGVDRNERVTVARDLLIGAVLRDDAPEARALVREFGGLLRGAAAPRNIYWIAGYRPLIEWADTRLRAMERASRGFERDPGQPR